MAGKGSNKLDKAMADIEIYSGEQSNIRRGQRPELDIILARLNKSISAIAGSNKCFIMQLTLFIPFNIFSYSTAPTLANRAIFVFVLLCFFAFCFGDVAMAHSNSNSAFETLSDNSCYDPTNI